MKVITKMELQPDMVLGEDILDQDRVIYPAGTTITSQIIEKLKRYNLVCVTVMEDVDFATTHYEKIRFDSKFKAFERAYPLFLGQYKLAMKQLLIMGRKPADIILLTIYKELYYYITSGPVLLDYIIPTYKKYAFSGCKETKFALAELGNDAGIYGAAKLVL